MPRRVDPRRVDPLRAEKLRSVRSLSAALLFVPGVPILASKKKTSRKKATAVDEPPDLRAHVPPIDANLQQILADVDAVLRGVPPPEAPQRGDLVHALMHIVVADGLPCGYGQEAIRRIEAEYVDRNEFRVTEAYEVAELLEDLQIPDLFERSLELHEIVAQIYNDQNSVSLEYLREASISDRNNFFARLPAITPKVTQFLVNLLSLEECLFSDRSTLRARTRLGLDPKSGAVDKFLASLAEKLKPFGHLPLDVAKSPGDGKVAKEPKLCVACLTERLGPRSKK